MSACSNASNAVAKVFQDFFPKASLEKKQKQLEFKSASPVVKQQKLEDDAQAYKAEKEKVESMKRTIASEWGIPCPKPIQNNTRKGGPVPRAQKWNDGLYEWIGKVGQGELAKPESPPPKEFPLDWDHKKCLVWDYKPKATPTAVAKQSPQPDPVGQINSELPDPTPPEQDEQQDPAADTKPKRVHHFYPDEVREFYFKFEADMGGPRTKVVDFVKRSYPSLFTQGFNEGRVRAWEKIRKSSKSDHGSGWRLGQTAINVTHLAFLGSLILTQYSAGVPMTSKLLAPLIVGALAAKGLGDKVPHQTHTHTHAHIYIYIYV